MNKLSREVTGPQKQLINHILRSPNQELMNSIYDIQRSPEIFTDNVDSWWIILWKELKNFQK